MKNFFDADTIITAVKGVVGLSATGGGFYVSFLPKVEAWLRVFSLLIGCAVGIVTFVSILRKHKTKSAVPTPNGSATSQQDRKPK